MAVFYDCNSSHKKTAGPDSIFYTCPDKTAVTIMRQVQLLDMQAAAHLSSRMPRWTEKAREPHPGLLVAYIETMWADVLTRISCPTG